MVDNSLEPRPEQPVAPAPPRPRPDLPPDLPPEALEVIETLETCLVQIIGPDAVEVLGVTADTRLLQDLGLDSIELVHLIELVQEHYGPQMAAFLDHVQNLSVSKITRLTVRDVIEFIVNASV
ncbi:MAG: phosphopantetheine-binding protein [Propionibacteriaceae bacterium]|jgi:acyl carrier protein|nr:phosphopantetheine-binding protein [Propionibacteriaceae bacterium]